VRTGGRAVPVQDPQLGRIGLCVISSSTALARAAPRLLCTMCSDTRAYPINSPDMTSPQRGEVDPPPGGTGVDDGLNRYPPVSNYVLHSCTAWAVEVTGSDEAVKHLARSQRYQGAVDIEVAWAVEAINDADAVQVDP
jgi:hypothetical protein